MTMIRLSPAEVMQAAIAGVIRQTDNLRDHRRDANGLDSPGWSEHIEGAMGELAVAKAIGAFWSGNHGKLSAPDVGTLEVRTRSSQRYQLCLHPTDHDDRPYLLVRGKCPDYQIVGWILGRHGKHKEFWHDPSGRNRYAYFVPDELLLPFAELSRANSSA